jgi:hypothetical protein
LRLGSLYGPEAASPTPTDRYDAHLHTQHAGRALLAALLCPGGIYNIRLTTLFPTPGRALSAPPAAPRLSASTGDSRQQ